MACILSAALGAGGMSMWFDQKADFTRYQEMHARCGRYWKGRSPTSDAKYEFDHGRRGLLRELVSIDPSLDYVIPGLRPDLDAEIRNSFPIFRPKLDDLISNADGPFLVLECDYTSYRAEYNVAMLRLLGREQDSVMGPVSQELMAQR